MKLNPNMKKLLMLMLALALSQLACSLGAPSPQADQNQLDTLVAETMAAMHLQGTATAVSQPDQSEPANEGEAEQATPEDTATPSVTPTETPTLTPTTPPNDPKQSLGAPDWEDHFDTSSNWTLFDSSTTKTDIKGGRFLFTMYDTLNYSEWTVTWHKAKDFYMEVTVTTPNKCSGKDRYGLLFRAPDPSQGYVYTFSCDGSYRLSSWDGKTFNDLVKWSTSDHIISGGGKSNRMGVWVEGQNFRLYANGKLLTETSDDLFKGESRFGLAVASANTEDFTITFDDLLYWELE